MLAKCHQATTMISFHGKPPDPNTNLKDYNEMSAFWSILTIHIFPVTVSNHTFFLQNNSSLCVNKVTFCKKRSVLCSGSDMEPQNNASDDTQECPPQLLGFYKHQAKAGLRIVRPEYIFGVFVSRFAPMALSSVPFKEVIIFRDTQTNKHFSSFTGGPN